MTFKLTGDAALLKSLAKAAKEYPEGVAVALLQEGYALDAVMVPRIPVDWGHTRGSHFVAPPSDASNPEVIVGVGTEYAIYIEMARPGTNFTVGQSRFLGQSFEERASGMLQRLGKRAKAAAEAGMTVGRATDTGQAPTRPNVPKGANRAK